MNFDLVIGGVHVAGCEQPMDIAISQGFIAAIAGSIENDGPREEGGGAFAFPGFVESHIHLDKARILDRCPVCAGTLAEAVTNTARAKRDFTAADVYMRARMVIEGAILAGTTSMRSFVEVDPRAGFRSLAALLQLRHDYGFAIDLELCAFAQEGLTQEMTTLSMLEEALRRGADLVGGCPYTDPQPREHIRLIFDLAEKYDVPVDFHLDFDLERSGSHIADVLAETEARGFGGRVTIGHVSKLSAMASGDVESIGRRLADSGIGLTVLPATDLYLMGRNVDHLVPRGVAPASRLAGLGVTVSIASNNVLNPFTPYGDASLVRMANLHANVEQLGSDDELLGVFSMVSDGAARLIGQNYGLVTGAPADIVLLDSVGAVAAIREIAAPLAGWKRGRKTFSRSRPILLRP